MSDRPRLSVVLPTFDRLPILQRMLRAWESQRPHDLPFEVIVVDDGSRDGTTELAAQWQSERYAYRFLTQTNCGPAAARNRALRITAGELVLFTGDDIEPTPWLLHEHLAEHHRRNALEAVIVGLTRWPPGLPRNATMEHIDGVGAQQFSYHYFVDGGEYDFRHFYTSNVSVRRSLLDLEPTLFSTDFAGAAFEDAELAWRLSQHGMRIYYRAAAEAFHHHPYTSRSFFVRQVRCGEMASVILRKVPAMAPFVQLPALRRARRRLRWALPKRRALVRQVYGELEQWEERILTAASALDDLPMTPPADDLLLRLFRYAFLRGLATALHGAAGGRRCAAQLFVDFFPAWAERYRDEVVLQLPAAAPSCEDIAALTA